MELGLKGKRALVTGGSEGIGFAIAECLVAEGAHVILASRSGDKLKAAIEKLETRGAVAGETMDLAEADDVERATRTVLSKGHIDILVNSGGGPATGDPLALSLQNWDEGYQTMLRSLISMTKLVMPGMRGRKWGRILTVTSTTAVQLLPGLSISAVFRAGLSAWTKAVAQEVGRDGVLVNNLLPGPTKTARLKELAERDENFFRAMESRGALGRIAEPPELGTFGAFLCSAANTYITGADLLADGGATTAF